MKDKLLAISFICISFFIITFGISYYLFTPQIKLNKGNLTIKINQEYVEYGASSYQLNNKKNVKIDAREVNTDKIGIYNVYYKSKGLLGTRVEIRKVEVVDTTPPELTLNGTTTTSICPNATYTEEGYTAFDNYDKDITDKVLVFDTPNEIDYLVKDSSNNLTTSKRTIVREDKTPPTITLNGYKTIYLKINTTYNEPGYNITDNCEVDSSKVQITSTLDTTNAGSYTIKYSITDESSNTTETSRNIVVYNPANINFNTVYKRSQIYLTFDDGPSYSITPQVLDILKRENIKATFFVTNQGSSLSYLIKRAYDEGHTIALHTSSHNYSYIYSSTTNFFNDLSNVSTYVENIIGEKSMIYRFPGGSSNTVSRSYQRGIMTVLTNEMLNRGYHYFDWNVDSGDAGGSKTKEDVYYRVTNNLSHDKTNVVLMHDFGNNYKTLNALSDIINFGRANGYNFSSIDMQTPLVRQNVNN